MISDNIGLIKTDKPCIDLSLLYSQLHQYGISTTNKPPSRLSNLRRGTINLLTGRKMENRGECEFTVDDELSEGVILLGSVFTESGSYRHGGGSYQQLNLLLMDGIQEVADIDPQRVVVYINEFNGQYKVIRDKCVKMRRDESDPKIPLEWIAANVSPEIILERTTYNIP